MPHSNEQVTFTRRETLLKVGSRQGIPADSAIKREGRSYLSDPVQVAFRSTIADCAHHVAALEHRRCTLLEPLPRRHVPAERVGEPDDHAEHPAHRGGVAERLA